MIKHGDSAGTFRAGAFGRRIAWVMGLQFLAVLVTCVMGVYNVAPWEAVVAVVAITTVLAFMAIQRAWLPVAALATLLSSWNDDKPDPDSLKPERLAPGTDADVASLARGLHSFASRISLCNERERNFTRDASHELRSPLTVIKMSVDMLADEDGLSDFGGRSVKRIQRATRELEAVLEALLILARESDTGMDVERFVVNDVITHEMNAARELLVGRPIELLLDEPARFAVEGSRRVFSVLCWQLIRNACQQTERGKVVITIFPGVIAVSNHSPSPGARADIPTATGVDRHGFELAIAQSISDRFSWPLELQTKPGEGNVARIRFPHPLPAAAAAANF